MLCDNTQHQYLGIEKGYTRRANVISHKFCNDLIFFFREFIMLKIYFLDPLDLNVRLLSNCYEDKDEFKYENKYKTQYSTIEKCIDKGEDCEFVCKEFLFGTTSNLFIGNLREYNQTIKRIQDILNKYDPSLQMDKNQPDSELFRDEIEYPQEFFLDKEQDLGLDTNFLLNSFNMTQFETDVSSKGVNLIDVAINSQFYLTNSITGRNVRKNYGTNAPGEDNEKNGGTELDTFAFELSNMPKAFNQNRV